MFIGSDKETTIKIHLRWMKELITEYELIKQKKHPHFRFVSDLFLKRGIKKQNFHKYYQRYKSIMDDNSLLPSKRGPKNPHQHYPALINKITSLRQQ